MRKDLMSAEKVLTGVHPIDENKNQALAALFLEGFRNTIDAEYSSKNDYLNEIQAVIDGRYGQFLPACSYFSQTSKRIVGVTLVTLFRSVPLLAYAVTAPGWQGKGIATNLIQASEQALIRKGYKTMYLVVTKQNYRAYSLYRTLGFSEAGENWDAVLERSSSSD
ncbi:GNAT family N-acetyltransferase [Terribacillus saccharophilus]|uniref:GNAT family N-acetyltransferase n=1 Tax=Terribacillus saccharophilus TaxID=361277 RepID=UPI003981B317